MVGFTEHSMSVAQEELNSIETLQSLASTHQHELMVGFREHSMSVAQEALNSIETLQSLAST